jgi:hypothetical protein
MLATRLARGGSLAYARQTSALSKIRFVAVIRTYSIPVETPKTKVWKSAEEAIRDVETGQTVMVGGFGLAGVPGKVDIAPP